MRHADLWGARADKYGWLLGGGSERTDWAEIKPQPKFFLLKPFAGDDTAELNAWTAVKKILPVKSVGIVTARDALTVRWSKEEIWGVVREMVEGETEALRSRYGLRKDVRDWKVAWAQQDLRLSGPSEGKIVPILYRPFDTRHTYYTGTSRGFLCNPRADVMGHMLAGENLSIGLTRTVEIGSGFSHIFASRAMIQHHTVSLKEVNYQIPLYLYPGGDRSGELPFSPWPKGKDGRRPNLDPDFVERLAEATGLRFVSDGRGDLHATFGPEDVLAYIYAIFHSPGYRARYEAHLKLDFPRVPLPGTARLFGQLALAGHDLLPIHLLESSDLDHPITDYAGPRTPEIGLVGWSNGTVWLDAAKTNARQRHRATSPGQYGFHGVREDVWDFQIGGYQVCHKWLKDRKGRTLSAEDIAHYQKIIVAVSETISIMAAIDGVVEHFGGWPGAFQGTTRPAGKPAGLAVAAESRPAYEVECPTGESDR